MNIGRYKHKLFSLFSGAGGLDAGFSQTGKFKLLLANDILSSPAETFHHNFNHKIYNVAELGGTKPKLPAYLLGDISDINFDNLAEGSPDILIGGPPCQDFSIMRGPDVERQGVSVHRGQLYAYFIKALIHLQPRVFVFENVPGLKSANKGLAYNTILDDFSNLNMRWNDIKKMVGNNYCNSISNYSIVFSNVINSADFGIPQNRKRLFIIGIKDDLLKNEKEESKIKEKADMFFNTQESIFKKYPLTTLEAFEGLPIGELGNEYREIMKEYKNSYKKAKTERAKLWYRKHWSELSFDVIDDYCKIHKIDKNIKDLDEAFDEHVLILKKLGYYKRKIDGLEFEDESNSIPDEYESVKERLSIIPPDENHMFVKGTKWDVEGRGMSLIYRRVHPLKPSNTVNAHGGGGTHGYHYKRDRSRLTNREKARLQSFPDSFMFKGNYIKMKAQIGEAVPPLLGENIAEFVDIMLKEVN